MSSSSVPSPGRGAFGGLLSSMLDLRLGARMLVKYPALTTIATIAVAFAMLRARRTRLFDLFEALLATSRARFFEVQTNEPCLPIMLPVYGRDIVSESIVFADHLTTTLPANGAVFRPTTSDKDAHDSIEERAGGPEAVLEVDGQVAGKGGVLFHYNRPYGDVYMEIAEPFRQHGLGAYLVQELKRLTYELGAIPAARCNPDNAASRRTLQRAGFAPCAHILVGAISR